MSRLAERRCIPCRGGMPRLRGDQLTVLKSQLESGWEVVDEHHLEKEFKFGNFRRALDFTNRVGEIAEEEDHHPDIHLAYGKVRVTVWTHKIGGLSENDFIFAAKVDELDNG